MTQRDELEVMLSRMYYVYAIIRDKEEKRRTAINYISIIATLFFLLGLLMMKLAYGPPVSSKESWFAINLHAYFPTIAFVVWSGLIGGFMSLLVRLVNIPTKKDEGTLLAELETVTRTLFSGPIIGGIFALVLYFAFSAKLIQGDLFPQMQTFAPASAPQSGLTLTSASLVVASAPRAADPEAEFLNRELKKFEPSSARDMALLLIWCFIAGYSQTFVPDKLKSITSTKST